MKKYLLLLMALLMVSCLDFLSNSPDDGKEEVILNQTTYELRVGETLKTQNLGEVSLVDVLEDSRCPIDVECVWEGNLKISLEVDKVKYELNTALEPKEIEVNGKKVSIYQVTPDAISTKEIKKDEYIITIMVN